MQNLYSELLNYVELFRLSFLHHGIRFWSALTTLTFVFASKYFSSTFPEVEWQGLRIFVYLDSHETQPIAPYSSHTFSSAYISQPVCCNFPPGKRLSNLRVLTLSFQFQHCIPIGPTGSKLKGRIHYVLNQYLMVCAQQDDQKKKTQQKFDLDYGRSLTWITPIPASTCFLFLTIIWGGGSITRDIVQWVRYLLCST